MSDILKEDDTIILALKCVLEALKTLNNHNIIFNQLEDLLMNDQDAIEKMNQIIASNAAIVSAVTDVSSDLTEATTEINTRIVELQTIIDELTNAAPGLSTELQALIENAATQTAATATSLLALQTSSQVLADIVPNNPVPVA